MGESDEAKRQAYAKAILGSGKRLLALLNDVLDFSKVEAGKLELAPVEFSIEELLAEERAIFSDLAAGKGLELDARWHGERGGMYRADAGRLRQMLSNLAGNAVKFTGQGSVAIEAVEVAREGSRGLLEFSVSDTGIGVDQEQQERLFKPFSQASAATSVAYGGTGLGLSLVASFAALMGGGVGVQSRLGEGARFWFRVWADALEPAAQAAAEPLGLPGASTASPTPAAEKAKRRNGLVLVAEDHPINRLVMKALLEKFGVDFDFREDGKAAFDALSVEGMRPALVFMDVQMPVMDGIEATKAIREWEAASGAPRTPIVALSAGAFAEDSKKCLEAGMDGFMSKPVDGAKLVAEIDRWLS
jgi:CheY-like chemotaxis protein